jgi:hypothetical protein
MPIHFVLDSYSVHPVVSAKALTGRLGIELHEIPADWTDELRPLDCYIFGTLKSTCRRSFHHHYQHHDDRRTMTRDGIEFLIDAWNLMSAKVGPKA